MEQVSILARCQTMLNEALTQGSTPLVFLMNQATHQILTDLCAEPARVKGSRLKNWYFKFRKKHLTLLAVFGVPIADNSYMPDNMISLQAARPFYIQQPQAQPGLAQQQGAPGVPNNPFQQRMRIEEAPAPSPSMGDLDSGRMSPTDVLIRGMEGLDRVKYVAVLRIYQNGDIDASTNLEPLELQGAIQKFQVWAFHREGN